MQEGCLAHDASVGQAGISDVALFPEKAQGLRVWTSGLAWSVDKNSLPMVGAVAIPEGPGEVGIVGGFQGQGHRSPAPMGLIDKRAEA